MKLYNYFMPSLVLISVGFSFATTERLTPTFINKTGGDITLIFVAARDAGTNAPRAQVLIKNGEHVFVPLTIDKTLINGAVDPATFGAKIKVGAIQEDALYRLQIIYGSERQGYAVDLKKIYEAYSRCGSKAVDVEFNGFPSNINQAPPFKVSCGIGEFERITIKARPVVSKKTYQMLRLPEDATEWQILGVKPDTSTEWVNKMYREKRGFFPNDPEALKLFDWAYHTINDKRAGETISYKQ